jgi:leucyl-tRNA synthetase
LAAGHVNRGAAPRRETAQLSDGQRALRNLVHQTIVKVSDDVGRRYTFNTAIAANMELLNAVSRFDDDSAQGRAVVQEALEAVVRMLSPMVPHVTHALWQALGHAEPVIQAPWPEADPAAMVAEQVELVVQVNGKLRGRVSVPAQADRAAIEESALADANVQRFVEGGEIKKIIVVPGKLINIVVAGG